MSTKSQPNSARGAALWLKRLWPLVALIAVMAFVFAMGWHRYSRCHALPRTARRCARYIDAHMLVSLARLRRALRRGRWRCRCRAARCMTFAGGFLFGWLLGGRASIVGATIGASIVFLIARSTLGESPGGAGRSLAVALSPGIPGRCLQLSAVPAAGADLSLLAGQPRPGAARRRLRHLCRDHFPRHHPGNIRLFVGRQRPRQRHPGAASCPSILPCQDGAGRPRVLPVFARSRGAFDTGADCGVGGAGPGGAHSGGGQVGTGASAPEAVWLWGTRRSWKRC